ncbi:MAG: hypothetical protein WC123_07070 [Bacilli bacterium]
MGSKVIDLTGRVFEKLTVIERAENYISPSGKTQTRWLCECSCEDKNKIIVTMGHLTSGKTKSCGCLRKENMSKLFKKYNAYDLTGDYGIGYTLKGEEFYFDLEDYDKIKDYCWSLDKYKYVITTLNQEKEKTTLLMHRLITNCPDDMDVDHEFHETWDNRKDFLRIVTRSNNCMNRSLHSNNTSGVTGVYWNSKTEKWRAQITVDNNKMQLGSFDNKEDAIEVRKQAELEYFGEYRYMGIESSEKEIELNQ